MSTIYRTTRTTTVNRLEAAPAPAKRAPGRPKGKAKVEKPARFKSNFEIIGYDETTKTTDDALGRVLIDGIVPIELALMFKSLSDAYNNGTLLLGHAKA